MTTTSSRQPNLLQRLLTSIFGINKNKTHDLRKLKRGVEYAVEFFESYSSAKLITGLNIKVGDLVILSDREITLKYRVGAIDFYGNCRDIREIKLTRIKQ